MHTDQSSSTSPTLGSEPHSHNHFLLRGSPATYFKEELLIDFEPVKAIDPAFTPQRLTTFSIIPTFNSDGKYYTTAFLNPFDDEMDEDWKMLTQHQTRVKEYSEQIAQEQILLPKPRNLNPYCCICKRLYPDYLEHINSACHARLMKNSRWSKMIEGLTEECFPKVRKSRRLISKRK